MHVKCSCVLQCSVHTCIVTKRMIELLYKLKLGVDSTGASITAGFKHVYDNNYQNFDQHNFKMLKQ